MPFAWLLFNAIVVFVALQTEHWFYLWIVYILFFDALGWRIQRQRWIDKRMKLRSQMVPEPKRFESLAMPRCNLVLESAGEDIGRAARELQRVYIIAPREARELCNNVPATLKTNVWHAEAELVKSRLEAVGAIVQIVENEQDS
ncbi:MAG: ribosomal protein L7/L12 [Armatimonadota bacterium]